MLNDPSRLPEISSSFEDETDRGLLLVDDDAVSCARMAREMARKGFDVRTAASVREGIEIASRERPRYAVVELRLADGNGLDVVAELHKRADARVIMLTAYGSIATAVAAIKVGAVDYLAKPANPDEIETALLAEDKALLPPPPENPMSADDVRWQHIQRVYYQYDCNVSETARRLHMHRRTLQRILSKHAPRDNRGNGNDNYSGEVRLAG